MLGHSQAVRQRVLIPRFPGSIPGAPATLSQSAVVAELVDALASGASVRKDVRVQVPPSAPLGYVDKTKPVVLTQNDK